MQKKLLYIKLTNGYKEEFAYQENILPSKFKKLGYDVHLFVCRRSCDDNRKRILVPEGEYINEKGVYVHIIPFSRYFKRISNRLDRYDCLYKRIKDVEPHIIFVHAAQFLSLRAVYKYVKENPKTRLYIDNHADCNIMPVDTIKRKIVQRVIFRSVIQSGMRYVDRFYGVSPLRSEYLSEVYGVPMKKISTIPQGGDEDVIRAIDRVSVRKSLQEKYKIEEDHLIAVSGGLMSKKKNIRELLAALKNFKQIEVLLLGVFPETEQDVCQECLNAENVHFVGEVKGEETYRFFAAADFAIFPGAHSVMWDQAVATGIPVVLRKWKGMDYFDINGNALYLHEGTTEEITRVLACIAKDGEKLYEMKKAALGRPMELFSYIEIAKQILEKQ